MSTYCFFDLMLFEIYFFLLFSMTVIPLGICRVSDARAGTGVTAVPFELRGGNRAQGSAASWEAEWRVGRSPGPSVMFGCGEWSAAVRGGGEAREERKG